MDEPINWHDLEIFSAVLEHGSFTAAARVLGLSQPTVSRHIESLERRLGRELFARNGAGLEPSDLALRISEHAVQMRESMYGIQRALDGKETAPTGIVTLSLPYGIGGILIARALDGFHLNYPDISIDLKLGPLQSNLSRREADIELRWDQATEPDLITRNVGSIHYGLFAAPRYLERHGVPRRPEDLDEHFFPHFDDAVMQISLTALEKFGARPRRFPFRCSGNLMLQTFFCTIGLTISPLPLSFPAPQVVRVLPQIHISSPEMWLTMHSALRRNARIRAVWDWLVQGLPSMFAMSRTATTPSD